MPKLAPQLTDVACRSARPKQTAYTLPSGRGLYLSVLPSGAKQWLVRYREPGGKRGSKVIGIYPSMTLGDAQKAAQALHDAVRSGQPAQGMRDAIRDARRERTQAELDAIEHERQIRLHRFEAVAHAWIESKAASWTSGTWRNARSLLQDKLCPTIGGLDVRTLRSVDVIPALQKINEDTPSLGDKARQHVKGTIRYAIQHGMRQDGFLLDLDGIFPKRNKRHYPAITKESEIGGLLRGINSYPNKIVRYALWFCVWTALRPGVVASAKWSEIDFERQEWHIPAERMKTDNDHIASLPNQAIEMLTELRQHSMGEHVFPATGKFRNDHVNRDSLSKALRTLGFQGKHTPHGTRATLRTLARERLGVSSDVLEAQLAHAKRDEIQAAYDRTQFLDERRVVMQRWADYLNRLADGNIVEFKRA